MSSLTSADVLYLFLRELRIKPSVASFEDRKRIQKIGCIARRSGIPLSYGFNWYLQGPYSPTLAADLYLIATDESYAEANRGRSIDPPIRERLNSVRRILEPHVEDVDLLEAVASILFLGDGWEETLKKRKPHLSKEKVNQALGIIERLNGLEEGGGVGDA